MAEAVRVGRAYLGPALRSLGKPGVLRRDSSERRQGAWSSDRRLGCNHKWLRPLRHDTRPRPSRRLPGGRQGAGVCAGADLGTVGGGGLGQYRVRAAWRGRDGGRRGQAWPPREDARGLEPHPRGAAGKLTCGGRGPRWFLERVDLSLCPGLLASCFARGETEAWAVTCRAARTRSQDGAETLPRGSVRARASVTLTPPHPPQSRLYPLLPVSTLFLALPTPCFFHRSRVARWLVRPSFCVGADRAGRLRLSIGDMPFLQPLFPGMQNWVCFVTLKKLF